MTAKHFIYMANAISQISDEVKRNIILEFCLATFPVISSKFNSNTFKEFITNKLKG